MPGLLFEPVNRRKFLRQSATALAAGALAGQLSAPRTKAASSSGFVRLALLSDTHVAADPKNEYRKFLPYENLKRIVPQISEAQPEGVIIDGDLARLEGKPEDYQQVKELLAPLAGQAPIYLGLGNHDDRTNFSKVFSDAAEAAEKASGKQVRIIEKPEIRFILLDSLLYVNKVAGLLGKTQREWLDLYLAGCDHRPTVLFVHHTLGDGDGDLLDVERFFRLIQPYRKVKAIFYGHSHQYAYAQHRGIHLINLPAVGYNFDDTEPVGWVDARFTAEGAELTLKAFAGNRDRDGQTVSLSWRG